MKKYILAFLLLNSVITIANAAEPIAFKISPKDSHIKFQASQGGSNINGEFKNYTSDIKFNPEALDKCAAKVTIDIGSFVVDDSNAKTNLGTKEWFDTALFPQAVFEASKFKSLGDKKYEATGTLTIKGQAKPTTLIFTLNEFSKTTASITGETIIKRKDFKIGEESTDSVKDDVKVSIEIKAIVEASKN